MNNRKNDEKKQFSIGIQRNKYFTMHFHYFYANSNIGMNSRNRFMDSWIHKFMVWVHAAGEDIRMNQWMLDVECWMLNVTCMKMFFMLSWDCHWNPKRNMF